MLITLDTLYQALKLLVLPGHVTDMVTQGMLTDLKIQDHTVKIIVTLKEKDDPHLIDQIIHAFFAEKFPHLTLSLLLTNHQRKSGLLSHIPHVIAIASGKGGVAKSTTAVFLSIALQQQGLKVGLCDADIYGPSLPTMMGNLDKPQVNNDKKILPLASQGIKWMSIGCLIPPEKALIWRGPMVQSALLQLIKDVEWGELDVLILDLPPGTGDVHLTLVQQVSLTGILMVSTPQEIALADARKGINMFQKMNVPLLGMIETMAAFVCPSCHHSTPIFNQGGAEREALNQNIAFLGSVPLDPEIRSGCDQGNPLAVLQSTTPGGIAYKNIADKLYALLK